MTTRMLLSIRKSALLLALLAWFGISASPVFADNTPESGAQSADVPAQLLSLSSLSQSPAIQSDLELSPAKIYQSGLADGRIKPRGDTFSDDEFGANENNQTGDNTHTVSTIQAVALSTLLPGAGQWYLGKKRTARLFFGAEIGIWVGYAAMRVNASWRQDEVERFAVSHAGVDGLNRSDRYYERLKFFSSIDEYNTIGRALDPTLPYIEDTPENNWNWDSPESQVRYRQLFNTQNSSERNSDFMFIAAVVNRLTSAALAWRSAKKMNNQLDEDLDEFGAVPAVEPRTTFRLIQPAPGHNASDGLMLAVSHKF